MNNYNTKVSWLGDIPKEWNYLKLKCIFNERVEKNLNNNEFYLSIVKDIGVVPYSEKGNVGNKTSDKPENYKMVYPGDLVVNPMNVKIGSVGVSKYHGCLSTIYIVLKCKIGIPLYYGYVFQVQSFQKFLRTISYGILEIRESVNKDEFFSIGLPVPPTEVQQSIVSFLDDKTSQIDTLISNSQKKIELLKEKRTALINHAVTKGLDPKAKMKDSGVEWIGEIPKGWRIVQLNHVASKITNGFVGPTRDILVGSGVKYIQGIHLKNDYIRYTPDGDYYVTEEWSINHSRSILKEGDVLLVQSGSIGEIGYVTKEFEGSNCHALIIVQFEPTIMSGKYFMYQLKSNYAQSFLQTIKTGEILQHLNTTKVKYFKSINPPIAVQQEIVEFLDHHTSEIDREVSLEEKRIELLKEYRQSLISEVVTGKINVINEKKGKG